MDTKASVRVAGGGSPMPDQPGNPTDAGNGKNEITLGVPTKSWLRTRVLTNPAGMLPMREYAPGAALTVPASVAVNH
jgi:hypothetical protein